MFVEVRLFATLRRYLPISSEGVLHAKMPAGYTVAELLGAINIEQTEAYIIMVNGVISETTSTLHEGDRLGLFPAVGG